MSARIIDGAAIAARLRLNLADAIKQVSTKFGLEPSLAVILVGNDPASTVYVHNKKVQAKAVGVRSFEYRLASNVSQSEILALVHRLNADPAVNGILVQLPLPPQLDPHTIITTIDPAKDVDGLHPQNVGRLAVGLPAMVPCTPQGCMILTKTIHASLAGCEAIVIGRSDIVGKPLAQLLLAEDATVTIAHSKTRDIASLCRRADILYAAIGQAEFIRGSWIKPGATVIDIGLNRISAGHKHRLVGDVAYEEAVSIAGAITPVPGGVGPMTIVCLLMNTFRAACEIHGIAMPVMVDCKG